ncbi:MAG TPA: hypothetical protein VGV87_08805, partial [Blastocatellia bacterium]|nr:hypothetical protein [Blastocatellia bacterium]
LTKTAVRGFERIIDRRTEKRLLSKEVQDAEKQALLKLVKKHSRGKDVVETNEAESKKGNVVDIMDVLKKSLAAKR